MMAVDRKQLSERARVWLDRDGSPLDERERVAFAQEQFALSRRSQALLAAAGESGPARNWYVLVVEPGCDIPVESDLAERGVETWLPVDTHLPKRRASKGDCARADRGQLATPGYIFIRIEAREMVIQSLMATEGVIEPIGGWSRPRPVRDKDINGLVYWLKLSPKERRRRLRLEAKANAQRGIELGDDVSVVEGLLDGHVGIVVRAGNDGTVWLDVSGSVGLVRVPVANL